MVCHRVLNIVPYAFEVNYREVKEEARRLVR